MNQAILLESNADNIDFMIHGIFSIKVFGQEVWITTSHACILIVMAIMVIFAIVANRKLKKAKEVPERSSATIPTSMFRHTSSMTPRRPAA